MLDIFRRRRMWRPPSELRDSYDVVIIGGGSHGLATAYYLREHGITNVCILERNYIGSGAAGRNTTILRSNYKTPEGARFYDASVKMYEQLSAELNFNMLFSHLRTPDQYRQYAAAYRKAATVEARKSIGTRIRRSCSSTRC